jgi:uncharacterized cupredoxin-like copper-binding protein
MTRWFRPSFTAGGFVDFASPRRICFFGAALVGSMLLVPSTATTQSFASSSTKALASFAKPRLITVVSHDFAFDVPPSIPAGLTTFRLLNKGKQLHHLSLVRLEKGKTAADGLAALMKAGYGVRPDWLHPVGAPNAISPGGEARATVVLEPGNYLAFCEVPGPDPAPHFMKGMVKGFTVVPPARPASLPKADLAIRLTDFDFTFSRPLTKGRHVIAVTNTGAQLHMLVINRHPPGKGNKEFLDWAQDPKGQPAPGEGAGGVTEIAPGATVVMERNFPPGRYGLFCFTPDPKTGKPHFMLGMQKEITVK